MCQWNGNKCDKQCIYKYPTDTTGCNADPNCLWSDESGKCRTECKKHSNLTSCNADAMCKWANKTCIETCSVKYTTKDACRADSTCMWDVVQQTCKKPCSDIKGEADCKQETAMCYFDSLYMTCNMNCKVKYGDEKSCNGDELCQWDVGTQYCRRACTSIGSQSQCDAESPCNWRADIAGGKCVKKCQEYASNGDCHSDITCQWNPVKGTCNKKCSLRYTANSIACKADTECVYSSEQGSCTTSCEMLVSGNECSKNTACIFNNGQCQKQCKYRYLNFKECNGDTACTWDVERGECGVKCETITDTSACVANGMCSFSNSTGCVTLCEYLKTADCNPTRKDCQVNPDSLTCEPSCTSLQPSLCASYSTCVVDGTTCKPACNNVFDKTECSNNKACMWDPSIGQCKKPCTTQSDPTACKMDSMCRVDETNKCVKKCVYAYTSATDCQSDKSCMWDKDLSVCKPECSQYSQLQCLRQGECEYLSSVNLCRKRCEQYTLNQTCSESDRCYFDGSSTTCKKKCAYRATTEANCNTDAECEWDPKSGLCGPRRCQGTDPAVCSTDPVCGFDATAKKCGKKSCLWGEKASCELDLSCEWSLKNGTCGPKQCNFAASSCTTGSCYVENGVCVKECNLLLTIGECAENSRCMWTLAESGREPTCTKRCDLLYKTITACNEDKNCHSTPDGSCGPSCQQRPLSTCAINSTCQVSGGACKLMCDKRYSTATECNNDPECVYDSVHSTCSAKCNLLSKADCLMSMHCYVGLNNTCELQCSVKYANKQVDCNADKKCVYADGTCTESCESIVRPNDKENCTRESSKCDYNPSSGLCKTKCSVRYGLNNNSCALDPNCQWSDASSSCEKSCTFYTATECQNAKYCSSMGGICRKTCNDTNKNALDCNYDPMCEWNSKAGSCGGKKCVGTTQDSCLKDADCEWNSTSCAKKCTYFATLESCLADSRCEFVGTTDTLCGKKCSLASTSDCASMSWCDVTPGAATCSINCTKAVTEDKCMSDPTCAWDASSTTCSKTCELRYAGLSTDDLSLRCSLDPACTFDGAKCITGKCFMSANCGETCKAQCEASSSCKYDDKATPATCTVKLCSYTSEKACLASKQCEWEPTSTGSKCQPKTCTTDCATNAKCFANCTRKPCSYAVDVCSNFPSCVVVNGACTTRTDMGCVYSAYANITTCNASCSAFTVTQRREIIMKPTAGGPACDESTLLQTVPCDQRKCTCADVKYDPSICATLVGCQWKNGACGSAPKVCSDYATGSCPTPNCTVVGTSCMPATGSCSSVPADQCAANDKCQLVSGKSTLATSVMYTPGTQSSPLLKIVLPSTADSLLGATVAIAKNYARGLDMLKLTSPVDKIEATWNSANGLLTLRGTAPASSYQTALQNIVFISTSTSNASRVVTWNIGDSTKDSILYNADTDHYYYFFRQDGVTWSEAKSKCSKSSFNGLKGYLATITSDTENDFIASTLSGEGWIGAADFTEGEWRWVTGPEASQDTMGLMFWKGNGPKSGGALATSKSYANWEAPSALNVGGEPNNMNDEDFAMMIRGGFWKDSKYTDSTHGFVCEYGTTTPTDGSVSGKLEILISGCVSKPCTASDQSTCEANPECSFDAATSKCGPGCSSISTSVVCSTKPKCRWNTVISPPACVLDKCKIASPTDCAKDPQCEVTDGVCQLKTGCDQYLNPGDCATDARCEFSDSNKVCQKKSCTRYMQDITCDENCESQCRADPTCIFSEEADACIDNLCTFKDSATCAAKGCQWRAPEENQNTVKYEPGASPALVLAKITATVDETIMIPGAAVSIEKGFMKGDLLMFASTTEIEEEWDAATGTLYLVGMSTVKNYMAALKTVLYTSSNKDTTSRLVSWALGSLGTNRVVYFSGANNTNSFYEYVATKASFGDAMSLCPQRKLFDNSGFLSTVASDHEQHVINQELRAQPGWICGVGTKDKWSWKCGGPTVDFFIGTSRDGVRVPGSFSNFLAGQPNVAADEVQGLTVDATGKWIGTPRDTVMPGFYCEYIASSTSAVFYGKVTVQSSGCTPAKCSYSDPRVCKKDLSCVQNPTTKTCGLSPCEAKDDPNKCREVTGCFWEPDSEDCLVVPACADNMANCTKTCANLPTESSCGGVDDCEWNDLGGCAPRMCGESDAEKCSRDPLCEWSDATNTCGLKKCPAALNETTCVGTYGCAWNDALTPKCDTDRCPWSDPTQCNLDPECFWKDTPGKCTRNVCPHVTMEQCATIPTCVVNALTQECVKKLCAVFSKPETCNTSALCQWKKDVVLLNDQGTVNLCTEIDMETAFNSPTFNAPVDLPCTEKHVAKNYVGLGVGLALLAAAVLGAFAWLWWRQKDQRPAHHGFAAKDEEPALSLGSTIGNNDNEL